MAGARLPKVVQEIPRLRLDPDANIPRPKREHAYVNLRATQKSYDTPIVVASGPADICLNNSKRVSPNARGDIQPTRRKLSLQRSSHGVLVFPKAAEQINGDLRDMANFYDSLEGRCELVPAKNESLVYNSECLIRIREAGRNVILGLETEFFVWDPVYMRFELICDVELSSFSDYLQYLSRCGSLIRRLLHAVRTIKAATQNLQAPLCLLAISAVIEQEVMRSQRLLSHNMVNTSNLIDLLSKTERHREDVYSLAVIIGCGDLQRKGKLSRIPSSVEVLERVYFRAMLLNSALLWRVTTAVMKPWIDQLNFVTGLGLNHIPCCASTDIQKRNFPEIFIGIDSFSGQVILNRPQIPKFLPVTVAEATLSCYKLLCFISETLPEVGAYHCFVNTDIEPLSFSVDTSTAPDSNVSRLNITVPASIETNLNHLDSVPRLDKVAAVNNSCDKTIYTAFATVFDTISRRAIELNLAAKFLFVDKFMSTLTVIFDVYLLSNGRFWSLLIDLLPKFQSSTNARRACADIQNLITTEFGSIASSILTVADSDDRLGLRIEYKSPVPVERLLNSDGQFWVRQQQRFTKLLALYYTNQAELQKYSTAIQSSIQQIKNIMSSDRAGLSELVASLNEIPY